MSIPARQVGTRRPMGQSTTDETCSVDIALVEPYWRDLSEEEQEDLLTLNLGFLHERAQHLSGPGMMPHTPEGHSRLSAPESAPWSQRAAG